MAIERHSRRSFLQGKAALREITEPPEHAGRPSDIATPPGERLSRTPLAVEPNELLASVRRRAMACDWEVQLSAQRDDDSMEHVFQALDLVEELEDQMSVYRDHSEVMSINRLASEQPVEVEPRLFAVFQHALQLHRDTEGAFDITSGPLSEAWGFSRREGRLPSDSEIEAALGRTGMVHLVLDEARSTIAFTRPGVQVNLNSIGKGYALDRVAELLDRGGVGDYLLHGGRSSVLARGEHPGRAGGGWSVGLRDPLRPAERLAEFDLCDESLSTSGAGTQFFYRRGRRYGHILDPRTGRPAEGMYSATVIAPTAAEADALSTAFYVMGPDGVAAYCSRRPEIAAVLVCPAVRQGDVRLLAYNLSEQRWRPLTTALA